MAFTSIKRFAQAKVLMAAFAAVIVAFAGTAGVAGATTGQAPTKEQCRSSWQALGYRNQGQCMREAAQNQGSGYGGNTNINVNVNININVTVVGNNNMIVIVVPPYWS